MIRRNLNSWSRSIWTGGDNQFDKIIELPTLLDCIRDCVVEMFTINLRGLIVFQDIIDEHIYHFTMTTEMCESDSCVAVGHIGNIEISSRSEVLCRDPGAL